MPIIFNPSIILQILISGICILLMHLLFSAFGIDYNVLGKREFFVSCLIAAFISLLLHLKGLEGHLFFVPTWLLLIIIAKVSFNANYDGKIQIDEPPYFKEENILPYQLFFYTSVIFLFYFYYSQYRKKITKCWSAAKDALETLRLGFKNNNLNTKEFWSIASHAYYVPPEMFFKFYTIWKTIYNKPLEKDTFYDHYKVFFGLINLDGIDNEQYRNWMFEIKYTIEIMNNNNQFIIQKHWFEKLATVIDYMNKKENNSRR